MDILNKFKFDRGSPLWSAKLYGFLLVLLLCFFSFWHVSNMSCMLAKRLMEAVSAFGTIVGGVAAFLLFMFTLPNEMKRWRRQRTYDERLRLGLEFADLQFAILNSVMTILSTRLRVDERDIKNFHDLSYFRIEATNDTHSSLIRFMAKADLLIPSDESAKAKEMAAILRALLNEFTYLRNTFKKCLFANKDYVFDAPNLMKALTEGFTYQVDKGEFVPDLGPKFEKMTKEIHEGMRFFIQRA